MTELQPDGIAMQCDACTAIAYVRLHARDPRLDVLFCGHFGHLLIGPEYAHGLKSVRYDLGDLHLVQSLYGDTFDKWSVERITPGINELAHRRETVMRRVKTGAVEWWKLGETTALVPVLQEVTRDVDFVAVAPATSDLPYERFAFALDVWLGVHPEFAK